MNTSVSQLGDLKKLKERLDRAATHEMVDAVQDPLHNAQKEAQRGEFETKFGNYKTQNDGLTGSNNHLQLDKADTALIKGVSHRLDHITTTTSSKQAADMAALRQEVQALYNRLQNAETQHQADLVNCRAAFEARLEKEVETLSATIQRLSGPTTATTATIAAGELSSSHSLSSSRVQGSPLGLSSSYEPDSSSGRVSSRCNSWKTGMTMGSDGSRTEDTDKVVVSKRTRKTRIGKRRKKKRGNGNADPTAGASS